MTLFVPYYPKIRRVTRTVLIGYDYEPVLLDDGDGYPRYFQQRWREGASFINCERDVVFWHGAIESLERCPEEWCAFGILESDSFATGTPPTLGLVKFSAEFIKKYPHVWDDMLSDPRNLADDTPMWEYCDHWIDSRLMVEKQVPCHQHYPPVCNANPYSKNVLIQL